jgi:MFS family permease
MGFAFGVFVKSISAEFGWNRGTLGFCVTSFLIASGVGSLAIGHAIQRWGVRRTSIVFLSIFAAATSAVGILPASRTLMHLDFAIIGFFGTAASGLPYSVSICGWFDEHRGLALALAIAGGGLGTFLAPQYATFLLAHVGWRHSFVALGATIAVISLFGMIFLVRDPPLLPPPDKDNSQDGRTGAMYLSEKPFWLIALLILGLSVATWGILPNIVPLLTDRGVSPVRAATVLSSSGLASWIGRLAAGYLMDRIFAPIVAIGIVSLAALGLLLLAWGVPVEGAYVGAAMIGVAIGSEADILTYMVSRYFSQRVFSRVVGAMWVVWCWGGGAGTFLAGAIYNATNSYVGALWVFGFALLLALGATLLLGPYVFPRRSATPALAQPVSVVSAR